MNLKGSSPKTSDSDIECQPQNLLKSVKQMSDPSLRSYAVFGRGKNMCHDFVQSKFKIIFVGSIQVLIAIISKC